MLERLLQRIPLAIVLAIPSLAAFLLYLHPALSNDFVSLDDGLLITGNPAVWAVSWRTLAHIFTHYDPELYIPLTFFSYQLNFLINGLDPRVFHLTNLLLHCANTSLLAWMTWRLSGRRLPSLIVALIFAIHPLNTEAVLWAAARKDLLSGFFALVSAAYFLEYRIGDRKSRRTRSIVFYVLALLSKVSVAPLFLIFFLYDYVSGRDPRHALRDYIPFVCAAFVFVVIAIYGKSTVLQSSGPIDTVLLAAKSGAFYLWKLIWPSGLTVMYPQAGVSLLRPEFAVPLLLMIALGCAALVLFQRKSVIGALLLVFLLFLVPNSTNFFKNGFLFFASDRYAYLAAIGIMGVVALLLSRLDDRSNVAISSGLAAVLVVTTGFLAMTSVTQAKTWKDSEALYRRVLAVYPHSAVAWNNLGDTLMKAERRDEAKEAFDRAIAEDPNLMSAHLNRGDALRVEGRFEEALPEMRRAVEIIERKQRLNLDELGAYYYLGQTLEQMGRIEESIATFKKAVDRLPDQAEPHYNYGIMLEKHDRKDEAYAELRIAVELEPLYIAAWYHLAALEAERGLLDQAEQSLLRVVSLNPRYEKAAEHLEAIRRIRAGQ